MKMEDYYKILGIPRTASADEIRKAYHRQAKKYHPDTGGSEEKFKLIGTAYSVLSDAKKRADYDLTLRRQSDKSSSSGRSAASGNGHGRSSSAAGYDSARSSGTNQRRYNRRPQTNDWDSMGSAWDLWHEVFGEFEQDVWSSFYGKPNTRSSGYNRRRYWEDSYDDDFQDDDSYRGFHKDRKNTGRRRSGASRSQKRKTSARPKTPQDLHATVKITASEARFGCSKKVHIHYKDVENGNVYDKFRVDKSYLARIPAGAYGGMKILLQGAGKPPEAGGSGNVLVTVKVI